MQNLFCLSVKNGFLSIKFGKKKSSSCLQSIVGNTATQSLLAMHLQNWLKRVRILGWHFENALMLSTLGQTLRSATTSAT